MLRYKYWNCKKADRISRKGERWRTTNVFTIASNKCIHYRTPSPSTLQFSNQAKGITNQCLMTSVFKDIGANSGVLSGLLYSYAAFPERRLAGGPWVVHVAGTIQSFAVYFLIQFSLLVMRKPSLHNYHCHCCPAVFKLQRDHRRHHETVYSI